MNYAHRFSPRPDDADPAVFWDFLDTYTTETQLSVGGRVLEVELIVDVAGSYDGTGLLPGRGGVEVVGRHGGRRVVHPPLCGDTSRLKQSGFTRLLTEAVNNYLLKHWDDVEEWAMERIL